MNERSGNSDVNRSAAVLEDVASWLDDHWDPKMPLRHWWECLGLAGWARPDWPVEWFGKGLTAADGLAVTRAIHRYGAIGGPTGFGANMGGPTLLAHGDDDQRRRHLRGMVTGVDAYCQLFSEPNAGSDLAGLQTRAELDGGAWVINGQKVWSSRAATANKALVLARTNVDAPKHAGISYFLVDLRQSGVEVRPLREMTGRSHFNEVFLNDVRVDRDDLIGGEGKGWQVASSTLEFERALSSGHGDVLDAPEPGELAGNLDRPAGEFAKGGFGGVGAKQSSFDRLVAYTQSNGSASDPKIRDGLVRLYAIDRLNVVTNDRARALQADGGDLPGFANIGKMAQSHTARLGRDLTFAILGPLGTLHDYNAKSSQAIVDVTGKSELPELIYDALWAQGPPIYGGSDQIQRNIIGERILGLPREPGPSSATPFRDLPKN